MPRAKKRRKIYDVRVWPTWLLVGFAWLLVRLPLPALAGLARLLGDLTWHLGRSRRRITETNLALCFPDLDSTARREIARASFRHTAMGALEAMLVWLNPGRDLTAHMTVLGEDVLRKAQAGGRGVILLGGHFSTMDVLGPAVKHLGLSVIYRENRNPVWEWLQVSGRQRYFDSVIERSDARAILSKLKEGGTIWYAPDQDYGRRRSVFAPFFGVPAASITATARLAAHRNSPVLLTSTTRDFHPIRWSICFHEPLKNYPTGDPVADATLVNEILEAAIREHPEHYLWMHRRFKTRPDGEESLY